MVEAAHKAEWRKLASSHATRVPTWLLATPARWHALTANGLRFDSVRAATAATRSNELRTDDGARLLRGTCTTPCYEASAGLEQFALRTLAALEVPLMLWQGREHSLHLLRHGVHCSTFPARGLTTSAARTTLHVLSLTPSPSPTAFPRLDHIPSCKLGSHACLALPQGGKEGQGLRPTAKTLPGAPHPLRSRA